MTSPTSFALPSTEPRPPRGGPVRPSRRGKWRTAVLIAVHVAIAVHILHWVYAGETITPIEPSESMNTLERGIVNAGFIFFVVTILATLVLGRWFCGWACHVVAYQDAAAWLLGKFGLRPKPIRSRLLVWAPFAVAFYMFVWPQLLRWSRGERFPELRAEYFTDNFWGPFAGPAMAVLTLLVSGFCVVYWLGAKGFCTYGCPYGAFYGIVDRAAPGRIRVTDACRGCRHCTSACTSNVLVHEEVLRYGMVVDPACMKCMDCVDVCPKGALYFGFGRPALAAIDRVKQAVGKVRVDLLIFVMAFGAGWWWLWRMDYLRDVTSIWLEGGVALGFALAVAITGRRARHYDFTRGEELVMAAVFLVSSQWVWRRLYTAVPLLLAIGLGALTALACIAYWRLLTRRTDFSVQHHVLRTGGRLTRAGLVFAIGCSLWLGFTGHSAYVQYHTRTAEEKVELAVLTPPGPAKQSLVVEALAHLDTVDRVALFDSSFAQYLRGKIQFFLAALDAAERAFERSVELNPKSSVSWLELARVREYKRNPAGALAAIESLLEHSPSDPLALDWLAQRGLAPKTR